MNVRAAQEEEEQSIWFYLGFYKEEERGKRRASRRKKHECKNYYRWRNREGKNRGEIGDTEKGVCTVIVLLSAE